MVDGKPRVDGSSVRRGDCCSRSKVTACLIADVRLGSMIRVNRAIYVSNADCRILGVRRYALLLPSRSPLTFLMLFRRTDVPSKFAVWMWIRSSPFAASWPDSRTSAAAPLRAALTDSDSDDGKDAVFRKISPRELVFCVKNKSILD